MTLGEARAALPGMSDPTVAMDVLATISALSAESNTRDEGRDLLIRALEWREAVPQPLQPVLAALIREHGLFPYLREPEALSLADQIAYEAHRPLDFPEDEVVFHAEQAEIYRRLLNGENVVLSAPTSFGKSLVVDAVLAARDFRNAIVIVPTIALIDETRRRLARLSHEYKIITHASQALGERNLIVITQERLQEFSNLPRPDFFVIDEFYKLDSSEHDDRADQLNVAFRTLLATGAQYYLLGPNISALASGVSDTLRATFFQTGFKTVASDLQQVDVPTNQIPTHLPDLLGHLEGPTLVFCRSPKRTRDVAGWLLAAPEHFGAAEAGSELDATASWLADTYHPQWRVVEALRHGIGIHHGRLPRAMAHHMVRLFNSGQLKVLLVTSTLIEGVNTAAQNVVVLDNRMGAPLKKYDFFTFSNILGRSGRMFKHYVGKVVIYNDAPRPSSTEVDIPILTQSSDASEGVLIHLPWEDLTPESQERMRPYYAEDVLSLATLRANSGIRPDAQLEVAQEIRESRSRWANTLAWKGGFPTATQLRETAQLIYVLAGSVRMGGVLSADVLGARLNSLRYHGAELGPLISDQLDYTRGDADEAVENVLDFMRSWAQFHVPRSLMALERIAREVLGPGSGITFANFSSQLEALFQNRYVTVLEEYGLPMPLTRKLEPLLGLSRAASLDDVLNRIRSLNPDGLGLNSFEADVLRDVQEGL